MSSAGSSGHRDRVVSDLFILSALLYVVVSRTFVSSRKVERVVGFDEEVREMPTFEHTVEIAAPIEHVVEFNTDPKNWPRTMASLHDLEIVDRTPEGSRMTATYRMLGISFDGEMTLTVTEPNERMVVTFESPGMAGEMHVSFSETDGGTRVVQRADYEFGGSLRERVLEPVAKRYNDRQFRNHLQNMKELLEAEATIRA